MSTLSGKIDKFDMSKLELYLPAGASAGSVRVIVTWLREVIMGPSFFPLPRCDSVIGDIELCRTAGLIGFAGYVQHIFDHQRERINGKMVECGQISAIETMAAVAECLGLVNDPAESLFYAAVRRFAYPLCFDMIADQAGYDSFMKFHPKLRVAVRRYVQRHRRFLETYPWPYPEGCYLRAGEDIFINPWVADGPGHQYDPVLTAA
ncbi:hypothetical protein K491DRAFT_716529 [Lophiostoma macrostomum CBS 122681]|uniref:Uncharacterized protein n=1 Tax=Lophiostoma macrostomum CBS 122681 TaxID=1314788 RepID=A0A6A6T5M8_9PLEO|nr:hypothetical protein K491DRAFT_716529 [Lophiostoma macrostomum CBS 122681]